MAWFQSSSWWIILMMGQWSLNPYQWSAMMMTRLLDTTEVFSKRVIVGFCFNFIASSLVWFPIYGFTTIISEHSSSIKKIIPAQNIFAFQEHVNVKMSVSLISYWTKIGMCKSSTDVLPPGVLCVLYTRTSTRNWWWWWQRWWRRGDGDIFYFSVRSNILQWQATQWIEIHRINMQLWNIEQEVPQQQI